MREILSDILTWPWFSQLCLLKNPSAAEILAFGRIGVRSGHA